MESLPVGSTEMEIGVLFADIRGFTAWSEKTSPTEATERLNEFYRLAGRVLTRDDAMVEFVGDQVMALYLPDFPSLRESTPEIMLAAARRLLRETHSGESESVPVGVGIHMGIASVGNVRKGGNKDFTAVGDVVNTAARLQSCASADQIVVSDKVYERVSATCPDAQPRLLEVKGKSEPVRAHIIDEATRDHAA
jgi:adenylate cyclase